MTEQSDAGAAAGAELAQALAQDKADTAESGQVPSCLDCFSRWRYCSTPAHQMKQYYVFGEIDSCQTEWDDLMLCFKSKLKPSAEARALWRAREAEKAQQTESKPITTIGVVWAPRNRPPAVARHPGPPTVPHSTHDRPVAATDTAPPSGDATPPHASAASTGK